MIPSSTKGLGYWFCHDRSKVPGFVNVPVMPQSIGKIVRFGFGILIPSTTKGLEYWFCQCSCDATEHWQNRETWILDFDTLNY